MALWWNLDLVWSGQHKQHHSLCMQVIFSVVTGWLGDGRYWPMVRIGFIATLTPISF